MKISVVSQEVEGELESKRDKVVVLREISQTEAEMEIRDFIKCKTDTFDDIEIVEKLNIPIEQVDVILNKIKKEGKIRDKQQLI